MHERIPHRAARDLDDAVERTVELDDEEDRRRDRHGGDEEHRDHGGVAWRVEPEAGERDRQPEDHDGEERERDRAAAGSQNTPPRLDDLFAQLQRLGLVPPLALGLRRQVEYLVFNFLDRRARFRRGGAETARRTALGPYHLDPECHRVANEIASPFRLGAVTGEVPVERENSGSTVSNRDVLTVERAPRRGG